MDNDQRMSAARQRDPVLAARIVRAIGDIEKDYHFASGPLSERLMRDVVLTVRKAAPEPWQVIEAGWSALLVAPEWKMIRGVGNGDAWLELAEICTDEDNDYSWIAAAVQAGPTRMGIELVFRRGLTETAQTVISQEKAVEGLLKLGFVREETDWRLFIPIKIPAEALAMGFEQNDLDQAMAPISKAIGLAIAAKAQIDGLIELIRTAAKRG